MMSTISSIPTFAVLGEPNDGKTTVVATLAEVDSAKIHPDPGTTKKCRDFPVKFDNEVVVQFVDTPGFEYPLEALEWFEAHEHDSGSLAEKFCAEHADSKQFEKECELLKPLAAGAAVIYVVDGSQPVRQTDRAQMEILRLVTPSDRPRVAVINSKRDDTAHIQEWNSALSKAFNIVREFNAHSATFAKRLDLLRKIRGVIQKWEPTLDACIAAFQDDWEKRIDKSADAICELLMRCLSCSKSEPLSAGESKKETSQRVEQGLKDAIRKEEERFRKKVGEYFRHTRTSGPAHDSLLVGDLFSKEVVSFFGLSKHLLALASASICAALAAFGDAAMGGASLGAFAAGGFVVGGAAGYWGANKLVSIEVPSRLRRFLPGRMKEHGRCVVARPSPLSNLPWVLLGRSIEFFHWASTWAHGRTDEPAKSNHLEENSAPWHVKNWSKEQRSAAQDFIALASSRKKKNPEAIERAMRRVLSVILKEMTGFRREPKP